MYLVEREIHFSYGHRLVGHQGKCAHLHGHNGRVIIEVSSQMLDSMNMVMDFSKIKDTVGTWIKDTLDHKTILWDQDKLSKVLKQAGETVVLMSENPTAEAIARWIFQEARNRRIPVSKVTLWETHDSSASYHE